MIKNNVEKEKVTGVLPNMTTGRLGRHSYTIIVTDRRLILAKYSTKLVKEEQKKAKKENKGGGFFSKWKASISSSFSFHKKYYQMEPHAILQESQGNYEIKPEEIRSIKVKSGGWDPGHEKSTPNKMEIKWSGGKNKFKFDRIDSKKVKKALNPLLGAKVH